MDSGSSAWAIECDNLWFSYPGSGWVLQEASFHVRPGEFLAVIGPNGGGKTTLLRVMLGLLRPSKGKVRIFGEEPGVGRASIGYVPQDTSRNVDFPITVEETVLMGRLGVRKGRSHLNAEDRSIAHKALERLGVAGLSRRRLGELSGGQRQRVLVARALASEPSILFLDEPVANVDAAGQEDIYSLLSELNQRMTVVVVSHDLMALSSRFRSVACVNGCVHYHEGSEITEEMVGRLYSGCPVELIAHGVPHRVLPPHDHHAHERTENHSHA